MYYLYKRGGWNIAVDATSHQDAAQTIKLHAMGAQFIGTDARCEGKGYEMFTAFITPKRQEQVRAKFRKEQENKEQENFDKDPQ